MIDYVLVDTTVIPTRYYKIIFQHIPSNPQEIILESKNGNHSIYVDIYDEETMTLSDVLWYMNYADRL